MTYIRVGRSLAIIAAALAAMTIITAVAGRFAPERKEHEMLFDGDFQHVLPEATLFEKADADIPYHIGYAEEGNPVGFVFITTEVASEDATWGFGGIVPVLVGMNMDGVIVGLKVLPNDETISYAAPVFAEDFLARLKGKKFNEQFRVGVDVDGISGATITSEAVVGGVGEAASIIAGDALGHTHEARIILVKPIRLTNPANLILLALVALAILGNRLRIRWMRYAALGLSVVFLGFRFGHLLSVRHFVGLFINLPKWFAGLIGTGEVTDIGRFAMGLSWFLPLILAGVAAFLVGRIWCGWICPFGAITELIGRLFPWKLRVPTKIDRRLRLIKYILLAFAPFLFLFAGGDRALLFEPFADTFNLSFIGMPFISVRVLWLIFLAIASLFIVRFYCRYLCPAGAGLGFIAGKSPFFSHGNVDCLDCAQCNQECVNSGGIPTLAMKASECLACGECASCIRIQKAKSKKKESA